MAIKDYNVIMKESAIISVYMGKDIYTSYVIKTKGGVSFYGNR